MLSTKEFDKWVLALEGTVGVDPMSISGYFYNKYSKLQETKFPIVSRLKIIKNKTELNGLEQALIRESSVLIQFYSQIQETI